MPWKRLRRRWPRLLHPSTRRPLPLLLLQLLPQPMWSRPRCLLPQRVQPPLRRHQSRSALRRCGAASRVLLAASPGRPRASPPRAPLRPEGTHPPWRRPPSRQRAKLQPLQLTSQLLRQRSRTPQQLRHPPPRQWRQLWCSAVLRCGGDFHAVRAASRGRPRASPPSRQLPLPQRQLRLPLPLSRLPLRQLRLRRRRFPRPQLLLRRPLLRLPRQSLLLPRQPLLPPQQLQLPPHRQRRRPLLRRSRSASHA